MKKTHKITALILLVLVNSCSQDEPTNPIDTKSSEANLLKLQLEHGGTTYTISISGTSVTLSNILPYGTEEVSIKTIEIFDKATTNRKAGDKLQVSNSPILIEVTAENGTNKKSYSINLKVEGVPKAEILKLTLKGDKTFATSINNFNITMNEEMHYLNNFVIIEELQLSNEATANRKVGDTLRLPEKTFEIKVTASEPSITNTYALTLKRDEGLQITPNMNLEVTSSYELQVSDVYVNGLQLTADWGRFFNQGYGDFNDDGYTDVLLAGGIFKSYEYSPFRLFYGDGTAVNSFSCECGGECASYQCSGFNELTDFLPINSQGMQHPRKIITGDYNNDGKLDAFILGHGYDDDPFPGEPPVLLINNGNGFDYKKLNDLSGFYHGGSSVDFDNDGDLDIFIIGSPSEKNAVFLINDGSANFTYSTNFIEDRYWEHGGYYTAEFIDINQDGYQDLIIGGHYGNEESSNVWEYAPPTIFWGNSYGKYFEDLSTVIPTVENFKIAIDFDAEDIDGDGDRDIIVNRASDDEGSYGFYNHHFIQILENQGNKTFVDKSSERITNNSGNGWREWIHLQDLDNDSDIDIYYEGNDGPHLKWLNNGQGIFTKVK
ncbi:VCBS repeat-containing protein [Flavobacteriaceae bacterium]|nr:VCBS repeat-containing protein [Flavobacteriaceae bacterium]